MNIDYEKPIIAVTGSAGKTMVKTLIAAILREKWVVFESNDYNNTTEKTLEHREQISHIHRAVVLEYGMAYSGVILKHCEIIKPNISVITNVGLAHIGNFEGNIDTLAKAKSELIKGMNQHGLLFVNADCENSKHLTTDEFLGKLFTVGIDQDANYKAKDYVYDENGMKFSVNLDGEDYEMFVPIIGKHNLYNVLFAIGVANQLGFTPNEIQNGLNHVKKPKHRLEIYHLKDGIKVIDDTIHANPPAMIAAIDTLVEIGKGKKIAVLGSMPELGEEIDYYHEEVGQYVASQKVDFLYTYGNVSINIGKGAIKNGMSETNVRHKTMLYQKVLHRELVELIEPGTTILVKGASRLKMFNTVEFLCNEYKTGDQL